MHTPPPPWTMPPAMKKTMLEILNSEGLIAHQWNEVHSAKVWPVTQNPSTTVKVYMVAFGDPDLPKGFFRGVPGVLVGVVAKRFITFCEGQNHTSQAIAIAELEKSLFAAAKSAIARLA